MATKLLTEAPPGTALSSTGAPDPTTRTRFLAVDGGRVAYDDTGGNGPLILALPGMGDLRSEYRLLRPVLQRSGYRVVTMDVRGFGETSARWNDYSAHAVGRDVVALLMHLNAGPAVILGNSFAAGSALWAAHDAPERVNGLVLLGPVVRDQKLSPFARIALNIGFGGPWRVWFWTTFWDSLFASSKPTDHGRIKAALSRNLHEPGRMAALRSMINLSKADTAAIVPKIKVSTLVVMGTRDPDFPDAAAEARWLASELGAETLLIEGAGHYPHAEMPDRVIPRLLSFIGGVHARDSTLARGAPQCSAPRELAARILAPPPRAGALREEVEDRQRRLAPVGSSIGTRARYAPYSAP